MRFVRESLIALLAFGFGVTVALAAVFASALPVFRSTATGDPYRRRAAPDASRAAARAVLVGFLAPLDQRMSKAALVIVIAAAVGYFCGRKGTTNTPAKPVQALSAALPNNVPSSFDIVKELNTHAGRLATVLAFVLAATTFSLSIGPVHDTISRIPVELALSVLGVSLGVAAITMISLLESPVPPDLDNSLLWGQLIARKKTEISQVVIAILTGIVSLIAAWFGSTPSEPLAWQYGFVEIFFVAGLAIGFPVRWVRDRRRRRGRQ